MSDYLWDRGGPVDREIAALETALAPLGYRRRRRRRVPAWAAVAAAALVGIFAWQLDRGVPRIATGWRTGDGSFVYAGERVRTGSSSGVLLEAADFGEVRLAPDSDLRVGAGHRMSLARGRLHALIFAAPGEFVVDTPSARAVDLGCQYDLSVDAEGHGFLTVETGWVAFQFARLESFIPAGAACRTSRRTGPGVPYYLDASPRFVTALERNDLGTVLSEARARDGLSLWHLLSRVTGEDRRHVFERFRELVPVRADEARVLALDGGALDECWNALRLDDAEWWRNWKRDWR